MFLYNNQSEKGNTTFRVFLFCNLKGHIRNFNTNAANQSKNIVMFALKKREKKSKKSISYTP